MITARAPATATFASASARSAPGASVLHAARPPSSPTVTVFAAPIAAASGATVAQRARTAHLCGMVTARPRSPDAGSARMNASRPSGGTGIDSNRQGSPSALNEALWTAGDIEWPSGHPMTA